MPLEAAWRQFAQGPAKLVETGENERFVSLQRPAERPAELMLSVGWLEINERMLCVQCAIAQKIKTSAVPVICT